MELEEAYEKIRRQLSKSVDPTLSQRFQSMQEAFKSSPNVFAELNAKLEGVPPIGEGLLKAFSELSRPATRDWNLDSDPNVPVEFKRKYRALQSESRRRRKLIALQSWISAGNPKSLNNPLRAVPDYGVKNNAICQYLKLAEEHHRLGRGPVTKGELWDRVCEFHFACFKCKPTHRSKILTEIGLGSLPERSPGRHSQK
jgi:hypothetical protein